MTKVIKAAISSVSQLLLQTLRCIQIVWLVRPITVRDRDSRSNTTSQNKFVQESKSAGVH